VAVEQHESNQIRDQRQPSYYPHCCYGRHDRMEYLVRRFTKNTEPKDEHEGALRKRGAGLPPCQAREHKEAERRSSTETCVVKLLAALVMLSAEPGSRLGGCCSRATAVTER